MKQTNARIVLLGGGTGSFTLLQGLKQLTPNLTAVVNMSDDGGSTGVLRDEYGVLPPGDARQCLVALSESPEIRNLFSYRFADGAMAGHTVGNLIISALEMQHGSFQKAIEVAGEILRITGRVLPVTLDNHRLVVEDGSVHHHGEHSIDGPVRLSKSAIVRLEPAAHINPQVRDAIMQADMVVLAPGSLHGSLLSILAVGGVDEALSTTKALLVSVANLINKPLQTEGWHVVDYVEQFERYIGRGQIDVLLCNDEPIAPALLKKYAAEGELPVLVDKERFREIDTKVVYGRLISTEISARNPSQDERRLFIRHDGRSVARQISRIFDGM